MHPDLGVQRRVLIRSYRLYLDADRAWTIAVRDARSWFPSGRRPNGMLIGDRHLRIRQLYEERDRALHRLQLARAKLENARRRLAAPPQPAPSGARLLLLRF